MSVEYIVEDLDFALYDSVCGCGNRSLEWECNFDADGSTWFAKCYTCGRVHTLTTFKVKHFIEEPHGLC